MKRSSVEPINSWRPSISVRNASRFAFGNLATRVAKYLICKGFFTLCFLFCGWLLALGAPLQIAVATGTSILYSLLD